MERLTIYIEGEVYEDHTRDTRKWKNGSRACMEKLAAYEDTGLTPEECAGLKRERDAAIADMRVGWLCRACTKRVVGHEWVSCKMRDLVGGPEKTTTCGNFEWRGAK